MSIGSGFFAPTPLTEETEAAGLTRLKIDGPLQAERGRSASWDVTRTAGSLTLTGTLFRYDLTHPAVVERSTLHPLESRVRHHHQRRGSHRRPSPRAVQRDRHVRVCPFARGRRSRARRGPADAAAQCRPDRHVGARGPRPDRRRVLPDRPSASRRQSLPDRERSVSCCLAGWSSDGSAGCVCSSTRKTSPTCGKPIGARCSGRSRRPMAAGPLTRGRRSTAV